MKNVNFVISLIFIPQFSKFTNAILSIKGQARNSKLSDRPKTNLNDIDLLEQESP